MPLLLGIPFLATGITLIDLKKGELTLRVGTKKVHFNLNQSLKQPDLEKIQCMRIDKVIPDSQEMSYYFMNQHPLEECILSSLYKEDPELNAEAELIETVLSPSEENDDDLRSSEVKVQEAEKSSEELILKEFPKHLKYTFLGEEKFKLVIIAADLTIEQEKEVVEILRKHKEAITWSVEDLKEISPSICKHKILMEENAKISIEHQRRLNPVMKEVTRKEVLKWLNVGLIYAISDSPWVSLVHVVLKKSGFTMIRNEKNELIPTRTVTGWRVYIDYRKLNNATRKDHYPLPFIDQMLDKLVGHPHYCFLDGYLLTDFYIDQKND